MDINGKKISKQKCPNSPPCHRASYYPPKLLLLLTFALDGKFLQWGGDRW